MQARHRGGCSTAPPCRQARTAPHSRRAGGPRPPPRRQAASRRWPAGSRRPAQRSCAPPQVHECSSLLRSNTGACRSACHCCGSWVLHMTQHEVVSGKLMGWAVLDVQMSLASGRARLMAVLAARCSGATAGSGSIGAASTAAARGRVTAAQPCPPQALKPMAQPPQVPSP